MMRGYNTATGFLELLARKCGRLLKGGEADVDGAAKMVLNDFLRGKNSVVYGPPVVEGEERKGVEEERGRLGEMGRKRKREDEQSTVEAVDESYETAPVSDDKDEVDPTDEDFEGFDDGDDEGGVEHPNEEAEDNDSNDEQVEGSRGEATELNHDNITLVSDDNSPNEQLDEEMQDELKNASLRLDIRSRKQRKKGRYQYQSQ
jgi:nuclear GTP-binding protein